MSVKCKIGPVMLDRPHDMDGYEPDDNGTEKFTVKCSHKEQAIQLQGLESNVIKNDDTGTVSGGDGWGLIPIDAAVGILDNEDILPRGYYLVKSAKPDLSKNPLKARVDLECEKISSNLSDLLEMDHSTGILDNTVLATNYPNTTKDYYINEAFDTFDTTNLWSAAANNGMVGASIAASGGYLVFTGAAAVNGTWKAEWTQGKVAIDGPFTVETDLIAISRPASGAKPHLLRFMLTPQIVSNQSPKDALVIEMRVFSTNTTFNVYNFSTGGVVTNLVYNYISNVSTYGLKLILEDDRTVSILLNGVKMYSGPSKLSTIEGIYPTYMFYNQSSTSKQLKTSFLQVYNYNENAPLNIVSLPAAATLEDNIDFNRTGADGDVPCCVNPTGPKRFYTLIDNFYKGSVKGWNSNNSTTTAYQLCNKMEVLSPGKFTLDNSLIKLEFTTNSVKFYYYASGWQLLNEFVIGTIKILKALYISPERITIQANSTKWTLERGKQFCRVQHTTTDITYTLKDTYDHDSETLTSPAANADVTMDTVKYVSIYNTSDQYRLLIIKQNPTTIKSDSLPADTITGIGVFNNSDASPYNLAPSIAKEFGTQTIQAIGLKEI